MKHRTFNADRFVDKFQGNESLLQNYAGLWNGQLEITAATLDVPAFKEFLVNGGGTGRDEFVEGLYRAYDLCDERGHEDLLAACRDFDYSPDPDGKLPVECLSLKVRCECEDAFALAYDRYNLWRAERFTIYRGREPKAIQDPMSAAVHFQSKLGGIFKNDKQSDRVLVRHYSEGEYTNFIVYHEKRVKAELIFKGTKTRPRVSPTVLRPAQQDFISYNQKTGQVEIEAGFQSEETKLRMCFAESCFGDPTFFEGAEAANRIQLAHIVEDGFRMKVDDGDTAFLTELHFNLDQDFAPGFVVRSKSVFQTLDLNSLRKKIDGRSIRKAVFKIAFPDDRRGKRVELSGTNRIKFKRYTHAEQVFRYLGDWRIIHA